MQSALIEHCEQLCNRIAVLDAPYDLVQTQALGLSGVLSWRARFDSAYAALYYPWLNVLEPGNSGVIRVIPACGHVLGQYASAEFIRGRASGSGQPGHAMGTGKLRRSLR